MFHPRQDFHAQDFREKAAQPPSGLLRRIASWPFRVAAARATMRQLAGLNDRELADIRLTRQDIRDASALALSEDPASVFAMRIRERNFR